MEVGDLDQQVRFEYQATTVDAVYGPQPGAWQPLDTVWAQVKELVPPRSMDLGSQMLHMQRRPVMVTYRWREDITIDMRVVLVDRGGRILRIVGGPAEVEGRKRFVQVFAEEFSTQGNSA